MQALRTNHRWVWDKFVDCTEVGILWCGRLACTEEPPAMCSRDGCTTMGYGPMPVT
jgi:hypothetical protein